MILYFLLWTLIEKNTISFIFWKECDLMFHTNSVKGFCIINFYITEFQKSTLKERMVNPSNTPSGSNAFLLLLRNQFETIFDFHPGFKWAKKWGKKHFGIFRLCRNFIRGSVGKNILSSHSFFSSQFLLVTFNVSLASLSGIPKLYSEVNIFLLVSITFSNILRFHRPPFSSSRPFSVVPSFYQSFKVGILAIFRLPYEFQ